MKKFLKVLTAGALALSLTCLAGACGETNDDKSDHTHTYATVWSFNKETHWHAATCSDAEDDDLIKDEAPHGAPDSDGKCPTCGYPIVGMTLDAFRATDGYADKVRDLARKMLTNTDTSKFGNEFVWIKTDSNNKLTDLGYLVVAPTETDDATAQVSFYSFGGADVDLKDVASGTATLNWTNGGIASSGDLFTLDERKQAAQRTLADKAFEAYKARRATDGYEPTYDAPLTRLVDVSFSKSGKSTRIMVLDVIETGYIIYSVSLPTETEQSDEQLIALLNADAEGATYKASDRRAVIGTLLYRNI